MNKFREVMKNLTGWLRDVVELGFMLILIFIIIDVLFPGTTGVMRNLGGIVGSFAKQGVVGLISLLLFLLIYKR